MRGGGGGAALHHGWSGVWRSQAPCRRSETFMTSNNFICEIAVHQHYLSSDAALVLLGCKV